MNAGARSRPHGGSVRGVEHKIGGSGLCTAEGQV